MKKVDMKSSLVDAVRSDNYVLVDELVKDREDVAEWRSDSGEKAIVVSCQSGSSNVFSHLIASGCSVLEKDKRGCSLLEIAIERSFPDIVNILHENGVDFGVKLSPMFDFPSDSNVLFAGNNLGDLAVNTLLEKHKTHSDQKYASVKILNIFYRNKLHLAKRSKRGTTLVDELLKHKVEDSILKKLIKSGHEITLRSPVQQVIFYPFPESLLECLVARGYSVNSVSDEDPCPPLFSVCSGLKSGWEDDSLPMLELLLKYGADVNVKCTPDFKVSTNRRLPELTWTLGSGLTALHVAAVSKSEMSKSDLVYMLCKNGADVNAQTESGNSPLLLAMRNLHNVMSDRQHGLYRYQEVDSYVIQVLLQYGADPDMANTNNESCLKVALQLDGYNNIKLMLLDTFINHKQFSHVPLEDISVSNISKENLHTLCHSPRNLKVLTRRAIHKATKGRHLDDNVLDFLPELVADYIKLEYFDTSWFNNPWTLNKS